MTEDDCEIRNEAIKAKLIKKTLDKLGINIQYEDVFIDKYYEYLESRSRAVAEIDYSQLCAHGLRLTNEDSKTNKSYSLINCLIFDTSLGSGTETFHFTEGSWYKVENSYIAKLHLDK
jgi:uncharacterized protein (TIGR04141 family)